MAYAYSPGPLENQVTFGAQSHTMSKTVWTKVLNNHHCDKVWATILVFALDGTKHLIDHAILCLDPMSSHFRVSDVSCANEFEVQVGIWPRMDADDVLVGVFGKDECGVLNPSHRLVHQEMTPIEDLCFLNNDPRVSPSAQRPENAAGA